MQFDNFTIRLLEATDAPNYFHLIETNRKRLEDFFAGTVSKTKTLQETETYLVDVLQKINDKIYFPYVVVDNDSNKFIGFIDVKNIDWNLPKAELGCYIDSEYSRKGISYQAMTKVIEHFFTEFKFNKLFLRTHETNTAARTLAEKCGFEVEGIIRKDYKTTKGEIVDLVYYGLLKK